MSEFLRYRRLKKRTQKLLDMDSSTVLRDFILDTRLWEAQQVSTLLGLPEITEDAVNDSEERSKKVSHLLPLIAYMTSSFSTGVMGYYNVVSPNYTEMSKEELAAVELWLTKVNMACMLGLLSQLSELGLIEVKS